MHIPKNTCCFMHMPYRFTTAMAAVLVAAVLAITHHPSARAGATSGGPQMPAGTWTIDASEVEKAGARCPEYLPSDTLVELLLHGVGRPGFESETRNELEGKLVLPPPHADALCATELGRWTRLGTNACRRADGRLQDATKRLEYPASFTFSRLGPEDPDIFFSDLGARRGAGLVLVTIPNKSVEWRIWLRSRDELVSECVGPRNGSKDSESFPVFWRRHP